MNKIILAASVAFAALSIAPAANASVALVCPDIDGLGYCFFSEANQTGNFGDSFPTPQTFTDMFTVQLTSNHALSITATKTAVTGGTISIPTAGLYDSLNNLVGLLNFDGASNPTTFNLVAGNYYLKFEGEVLDHAASYSGTIDIGTYVPEPATWAMMIAGIAAVGATMRRRVRATNVAFS